MKFILNCYDSCRIEDLDQFQNVTGSNVTNGKFQLKLSRAFSARSKMNNVFIIACITG